MLTEGVLALGLMVAPAASSTSALARCETARRANLDAALTWESRAEQGQIDLGACLDRLAVRTSTPTPAVVEFRAIDSGPSPAMLALGGTALVLVGVIGGILAALAVK